MRKICAVLISTLLIFTATQALAYSFSGAWNVNDFDAGDFFTFELASTSGSTFYLYDGDVNQKYNLLNDNQIARTVYIVNNGISWWATFIKAVPTGGFNLGATPEFKFMFEDSNLCAVTAYEVAPNWGSTTDAYALTAYCPTPTGADPVPIMTVVVTDVTPVPIPGALFLLGSGLIGLVGFRRRKR